MKRTRPYAKLAKTLTLSVYLMTLIAPQSLKTLQATVRTSKKYLIAELKWLRSRGYVAKADVSRDEYLKRVRGIKKYERAANGRYGRMVFYQSTLKPLWEYWDDAAADARKRVKEAGGRLPTTKDYELLERFFYSKEVQERLLTAAFSVPSYGFVHTDKLSILDALTKYFVLVLSLGTDEKILKKLSAADGVEARAIGICGQLDAPKELLTGIKLLKPAVITEAEFAQALLGRAPFVTGKEI
ncbi:MAG: hypothetical protein HYS81_01870 [Candidatus Aenigmatarchaeota archaeon]|nr:MAG: hypothetical protein HYS81_01870 [Candidatus Aenigmarchaeota archaeon]